MEKKYIEDKQGNKVLPITHVSAVKDDNGNSLDSLLGTKADVATTLEGYGITDTYTKDQLNSMITTPNQEYVTVESYSGLPASGSSDTIYRVCSWDGEANSGSGVADITKYSEYAWDGTQYQLLCVRTQIGEVFDISAYNSGNTYTNLADALGTDGEHVPDGVRRGGMSVKYVQTSDNKYVQYRLLTTTFSTIEINWQEDDIRYINNILLRAFGEKLNYYNRAEGSLQHSTKTINTRSGGYVNYYNVSSFSKILFRCKTRISVLNEWDILWVCDSSNNVLYQLSITQVQQEFDETITLNANADHVVISDYNNSYLRLYGVSNVININNLNETVESLSDVVDEHDTILNKTGKIELTKLEDIDPCVLDVNGNLVTTYRNFKVSVYDVSELDKVIASANVKVVTTAEWAAWQLRDSNRDYIQGTAQSINPLGNIYENQIIDVSNAHYLYIQSDNSAKVENFIGIQTFINELQTDIQNNTDNIDSLDDRISELEGTKKSIICWGDSLTNGAGRTPYTTYLQQLLGNFAVVYNGGVEADNTKEIIARQGGISLLVGSDFTLPLDTTKVEISIKLLTPAGSTYDGLIYSGSGSTCKTMLNPCIVDGIECTITKERVDNVYHYYINRNTAADSSQFIAAGTQIMSYGAKNMRSCSIAIFYCGQNDGASAYSNYIPIIKNGIDFIENKNFLVISTAISRSDDMENAFYTAFGANYINLYHLMSNYGIEMGIELGLINEETPKTNWNVTDALCENRNGLLKDGLHWNDTGLKILARFVYQRLLDLGFISNEF